MTYLSQITSYQTVIYIHEPFVLFHFEILVGFVKLAKLQECIPVGCVPPAH